MEPCDHVVDSAGDAGPALGRKHTAPLMAPTNRLAMSKAGVTRTSASLGNSRPTPEPSREHSPFRCNYVLALVGETQGAFARELVDQPRVRSPA